MNLTILHQRSKEVTEPCLPRLSDGKEMNTGGVPGAVYCGAMNVHKP